MNEMRRSRSDELHELLTELGRTVQEAVTGSPEVSAVLDRIRERGYEPSFVVETSVASGASASGETGDRVETSAFVRTGPEPVDVNVNMTPLDKKFLRSLKISVPD